MTNDPPLRVVPLIKVTMAPPVVALGAGAGGLGGAVGKLGDTGEVTIVLGKPAGTGDGTGCTDCWN